MARKDHRERFDRTPMRMQRRRPTRNRGRRSGRTPAGRPSVDTTPRREIVPRSVRHTPRRPTDDIGGRVELPIPAKRDVPPRRRSSCAAGRRMMPRYSVSSWLWIEADSTRPPSLRWARRQRGGWPNLAKLGRKCEVRACDVVVERLTPITSRAQKTVRAAAVPHRERKVAQQSARAVCSHAS